MKKRRKQKPSAWIDSLTATATYISHKYKISCTKHLIKYWQKKEPPFPTATANNRFNIAQVEEWVEKHYLPNQNKLEEGMLAREQTAISTRKILAAENEQFDLDLRRGKYIDRDLARRTIVGALKRYHGIVRAELERNLTELRRAKLAELETSPAIMAIFLHFDLELARQTVEKIELECEKLGKENI
jgi:hypothetical protein